MPRVTSPSARNDDVLISRLSYGCWGQSLGFARGKFFARVVEVLATEPPIAESSLTAAMHRFHHREQFPGGRQIAGDAGFLEHVHHTVGQPAAEGAVHSIAHHTGYRDLRRWQRRNVATKGVGKERGQSFHLATP